MNKPIIVYDLPFHKLRCIRRMMTTVLKLVQTPTTHCQFAKNQAAHSSPQKDIQHSYQHPQNLLVGGTILFFMCQGIKCGVGGGCDTKH